MPPKVPKKLSQLAATAICGNDISSSVLYVSALAIAFAGQYAWITLLIVSVVWSSPDFIPIALFRSAILIALRISVSSDLSNFVQCQYLENEFPQQPFALQWNSWLPAVACHW